MAELIEYPSRDAWLTGRREGIGSSDVPAILGLLPYKSAHDVWAEKVGLIEPSTEEQEQLKWGRLLEPAIAAGYEEETGRILFRPRSGYYVLYAPERPWLRVTPDYELAPVTEREGPGLLEIKNVSAWLGAAWDDEPPPAVQVQLQTQLLVLAYGWGSIAGLVGGNRLRWADQEAKPDFHALVLPRLEEFWHSVVTEQPPSAVSQSAERMAELLAKLHPKDDGTTIALPDEAITWDADLVEVKATIKSAEKIERELENRFKAAIGDATAGALPSGVRYSWKAQHRDEYTVAAADFRVLRRHEAKKNGR